MKVFRVQVNDEVAARFDSAAARYGGREALLYTQIMDAAGSNAVDAPKTCAAQKVSVSRVILNAEDTETLSSEAASMGMSRTTWIMCLLRRRLHGTLSFKQQDTFALIGVHDQLRRISLSLGQIAKALENATEDGAAMQQPVKDLRELRCEIRGHVKSLHEAFEGNLSYWEVL